MQSIIKEGKDTKDYEEIVADSIESYIQIPELYTLPDQVLVRIFSNCQILQLSSIKEVVVRAKGKQMLLLPHLKPPDVYHEKAEINEVIKELTDIPLFVPFAKAHEDDKLVPDRDWKYEIDKLNEQLETTKGEYNSLKKVVDIKQEFISYICEIQHAMSNNLYETRRAAEAANHLAIVLFNGMNRNESYEWYVSIFERIKASHKQITGSERPPKIRENEVEEILKLDIKSLSYDHAMSALERAISLLENPQHSNNEALYEKAIIIKAYCQELLLKEKSEIMRIARENNIPLSEIGLVED